MGKLNSNNRRSNYTKLIRRGLAGLEEFQDGVFESAKGACNAPICLGLNPGKRDFQLDYKLLKHCI